MSFKDNLKAELTYMNILVKELAALSGINKRTIDNYLREKGSLPSAEAAVKIARVLGVSVEYLVTGHEVHRDKDFTPLSPDLRVLLRNIEGLNGRDHKTVFNLVKFLKELEDSEKKPG
jgi:transcriptional regulator with XRE-family HTH domain